MALFSQKLFLYLKRNSLEIYTEKSQGAIAQLDFPLNIVKDEEIIDKTKFQQLIASFLAKLSLKEKEVQIILSDELIYQKTVPVSDEKTQNKQLQLFLAEIPFKPEEITQITTQSQNKVIFYATNKELFKLIGLELAKIGKKLVFVSAASAIGIAPETTTLTGQDLKKIAANHNIIEKSDFLSASQSSPEDNSESIKKRFQVKIRYFLVLTVVVIIIIIVVIGFLALKKPAPVTYIPPNPPEATSTATFEPSPSEVPTLTKDQIKIQILNGTTLQGQAGLVQTKLENIGYSGIQTGKAQTPDHVITQVDISKNVSDQNRQEIESTLKNLFAEIKTDIKDLQDFEVIITTGKQK